MRVIVKEDQPFTRHEYSYDEGLALFKDQPFKVEIINAVKAGASERGPREVESASVVSTYSNSATFTRPVSWPPRPSTSRLGHFKLMRVAGAYWRGDEKRPSSSASTAPPGRARQRSRRTSPNSKRPRSVITGVWARNWTCSRSRVNSVRVWRSFIPRVAPMRRVMEEYSRQRHVAGGYEFVNSPHITKSELFETSGHLEWFADSMYPPMELDDGQNYYLKPMNCPFHVLIFKSRQRSYRELPLRLFEFGTVYRYEKSGAVHGLTRVRGMTQDDAHIFCTREQMSDELTSLLNFVLNLLRDFGLNEFYLELSTRPEGKAVGSDEEWAEAESTLERVANSVGLELVLDEGGGAFYGPKISVQARDAIGRTHQLSTIQLDFQTPQRFEANYVGADNSRTRPIMIHRALFGSVERFMAILIEHYAGNMPTWLSPEQVRVLGVRDDHDAYAGEVAEALRADGVRVGLEEANEPLGARIRRAKLEKIPYILVVGDDDVAGANARGERPGIERSRTRRRR